MSSFFSYNVYLRNKSRSSLAQQGEFLSRNPDISNFFSNGGTLGYKYLFRMKDYCSSIECTRAFLVIICICETYQVLFFAYRPIFCKKMLT